MPDKTISILHSSNVRHWAHNFLSSPNPLKRSICLIPARYYKRPQELRQVRTTVVPNVKRETLQNEILKNVKYGSKIYTDAAVGYENLNKNFVHEVVNHAVEYVKGQVHTQGLDNFWSLVKRTLRGTYVAVEPFHLDHYLDEQVFRYNNRATKNNPLNDSDRFVALMAQVAGKRLTYAQLTGKSDSPHHPAAGTGQAF